MRSFDAELHEYKSSGIRFPGATDVIKSEGLVDPMWMSEEARWRGKCVHRGVELMVKEELDWDSVDELVSGYIRSAQNFIATTGFEVVGCELPCFDLAFACIPDLWGRLNGCNVVVELKTGLVPNWAAIQTALQVRALRTSFGFKATKRFGLQLLADGGLAKLKPFDNIHDERRAMSMVDSFWWKKENGYIRDWK